MSHQISFSLSADASADQVQAMIDHIAETFGIKSTSAEPVSDQAAAAPAPAGVTLDSNGLPWDERIHASTKTTNKDGSWKKLKGVDEATVTAVTAELKQLMGAPAPTVTAPAPTLPAVTAPTLPTVTAPALPPVQESPYSAFTKFIGANLHSVENPIGRLTSEWVNQVIELNGVPGGLANLAARPDLIPQIESQIKQALGQ